MRLWGFVDNKLDEKDWPLFFWPTIFDTIGTVAAWPVIELIARNIKDSINAITEAGGFNQTLVAVRPKRNDFRSVLPEDGKVLIMQTDWDAGESSLGKKWMEQTFELMAIVIDGKSATQSIEIRLNNVRSDIERKLKEDVTRGGHANDTDVFDSTSFDDGQGFTGITIFARIKYSIDWNNPYG